MIRRTWIANYRGRMWFPLWSAEFLRWQMDAADRQFCVAAYDADRLVGCFFSVPQSLRIGSTVFPMTFSSWYTIDPDYRLPRLALDLIEAHRLRHLEGGQAFSLGVVSGDSASLAHRFWSRYARACPRNFRFLSRFGSWVKVLNPIAVARAGIEAWERRGIRALGPVLKRTPWGRGHRLRPYQAGDLPVCAHLIETATRDMDWAISWSPERLARQLGGAIPRTLLFEKDGEVRGLVNYHHMQWQGRDPIRTALIDLWAAPGLGLFEVSSWMGSVCRHLKTGKVDAIICLRSAMFPAGAMVANAFVPLPAKDDLVALYQQPQAPLAAPGTWNLLLR